MLLVPANRVPRFVNTQDRPMVDSVMARYCRFTKSPVSFLRIVMSLRRKGQSFNSSHLGRILNGELLRLEDFKVPGQAHNNNNTADGRQNQDDNHDIMKDMMMSGSGIMVDENGVITID